MGGLRLTQCGEDLLSDGLTGLLLLRPGLLRYGGLTEGLVGVFPVARALHTALTAGRAVRGPAGEGRGGGHLAGR